MEIKMYSIRDTKLMSFFPPIAFQNDVQAERRFVIMGKDPQSQLHHFPKDYDLYNIGSFDTDLGLLTVVEPPMFVTNLFQAGGHTHA